MSPISDLASASCVMPPCISTVENFDRIRRLKKCDSELHTALGTAELKAALITMEIPDDKYYDDEEFENTDTVSISNNLSQPAINDDSSRSAEDKSTFQQRQDIDTHHKPDTLSKIPVGDDSTASGRIPFKSVVQTKDATFYETDSKATNRQLSPRLSDTEQIDEKSSRKTDSENLRQDTGRPRQNSYIDDDDDEESGRVDNLENEEETEYDAELLVASYRGDVVKVIKLIKLGARYDARDRHRWTALMWAAAGGYDDIIKALLGSLKRPLLRRFLNAKDNITGWTALHVSPMHDEYRIKSTSTSFDVFEKEIRFISHFDLPS